MIFINNKLLIMDSTFSGGELNIKLPNLDLKINDIVKIDCRGTDPILLFKLGLIVNAIKNNYAYLNPRIHLFLPYLPYARQDRVCNFGEAYGLEYAIDFLHSLNIDVIQVLDVHSDVYRQIVLEKKYKEFRLSNYIYSFAYIQDLYNIIKNTSTIQILPDAGMQTRYKDNGPNEIFYSDYTYDSKITDIIDWYNRLPSPIICDKVRVNNQVKCSLKIPENLPSIIKNFNIEFLITDDICDGGATFISLIGELKKVFPELFSTYKVNINLFVTHGIFRNGTNELYDAGITRIITTDSLPQRDYAHKGEFHVFKV